MNWKINKLMAIGVISLFYLSTVTATGVIQTSDLEEKNADRNVEWEKKVEKNFDSYESVWERPFSRNNYSQKNNFSNKISSHTPHFPIRIYDNDDFTSKNGVVAGDGTKENPYIMEGWEIKANIFWKIINRILSDLEYFTPFGRWIKWRFYEIIPICGIYIKNTDKHLIIRNNYIHEWKDMSRWLLDCSGIITINASNVTIENNIFENNQIGMNILNCEIVRERRGNDIIQYVKEYNCTNLTIRFNKLKANGLAIRIYYTHNSSITYNNISKSTIGIDSAWSRLHITHNYIFSTGSGIMGSNSSIIENNFIWGNGNGIYCPVSGHPTISNNTISRNWIGIFITGRSHPTISNNTITHSYFEGICGYAIPKRPLIIVDNIISNNNGSGIYGHGTFIIEHNLISLNGWHGGCGIEIWGNVSIQHNIISSNEGHGIFCGAWEPSEVPYIHYNNIFDNEGKGIKYDTEIKYNITINATYNYWGSPDGPSGYGNGHGDEVDKNIIYDPWLTEPNPDAGPR